jgi:hypothetical protein
MWQALQSRLAELLGERCTEMVVADLGFWGPADLPEGRFDLAIGHSFGLLWILQSSLVTCDRLISINGFTRFSRADDFPCGWSPGILQRMRKRLALDTAGVLDDFLRRAAIGRPTIADQAGASDVERLDWALEALINQDGRQQWSRFRGPRRAVAGTDDAIVTAEHTNQCFADSDIQWLKSDCHCLPVKFPEICAALVRELIEVS